MRTSSPQFLSPSKAEAAGGDGTAVHTAYPVLFHWLVLLVFVTLVFVSALLHLAALLVLSVLALVLALVAWLWSYFSLRGVACRISLRQERAFPGESVEVGFSLNNSSWVAPGWVRIEAELPFKLARGKSAASPFSRERWRWATSLGGGQRLAWRHSLECRARGDYLLGPVRLRSGDPFGLHEREKVLPQGARLLVYPRIVPAGALRLRLTELTGERPGATIFEDVSRTVGARDYRREDPFKRIHWKATAHRGDLQARQYESTTSLNLLLLLDVEGFRGVPDVGDDFELAVTIVASLAADAHGGRSPFGVAANCRPPVHVPVSTGREQLLAVLETLARLEPEAGPSLARCLESWRPGIPLGSSLVIIARGVTSELGGLAAKLRAEGRSTTIISVGPPVAVLAPAGVPAVSISSIADLSREAA